MNLIGELKYFLGGDHATLRFSECATSLSIDIVLVPSAHRSQGVGTALIRRALCLADAGGLEVHVAARPIGTHGADALERLVAYYTRFGFAELDRGVSVIYMRRARRPTMPPAAPATSP